MVAGGCQLTTSAVELTARPVTALGRPRGTPPPPPPAAAAQKTSDNS